ncbi:MAG: hypothetical protein M1817_002806 [Caeruleum heppii]|nr:MAG: hypothetical protein M1817_002806 [Caeruleum heppii]
MSQHRTLFDPVPGGFAQGRQHARFNNHQGQHIDTEAMVRQAEYLDSVAYMEISKAAIEPAELAEKDNFRAKLEEACRDAVLQYECSRDGGDAFSRESVELRCFGSLSSGFATKSSDMDLAFRSPMSQPPASSMESPIPRLVEKQFLDMGYGARLLTKTRVPIIKLCESPTEDLRKALAIERERWERQKDQPSVEDNMDATQHEQPPVTQEELVGRLSQAQDDTLAYYHRRAKRVLEQLGGRDLDRSLDEPLTHDGFAILNRVIDAFLTGLHDPELRRRLRQYSSAFPTGRQRTLLGTWFLAEGETAAMLWERRTISELNSTKEQEGAAIIREWQGLQQKDTADAVAFGLSLRRVWDKLKAIPSIRLEALRERREDDVDSYCSHGSAVLKELAGRDLTSAHPVELEPRELDLLRAFCDRWVQGVRHQTVRTHVQEYLENHGPFSVGDVQAQYRAERRIAEYLAAATKGTYDDGERLKIDRYAEIVRNQGANSTAPDVTEARGMLSQLEDPHAHNSRSRLEFPRTGVGIQCDVNFSNLLALENTLLLRCYDHCDPRVRAMVIFVKAWAKRRQINSPYHGTLSSYGYVLMVLHFLVNIASPPIAPNLQLAWKPPRSGSWTSALPSETSCEGYDIRFWRNEDEIKRLAEQGMLTHNRQSLGSLLRGFFDYFARQGPNAICHGFFWGRDVLSLRTQGGLLSKQMKGWTGAKTTVTEPTQPGQEKKEVRHRYLFAIEDPFEIDHNVARTVMHHGIVAIRDEFRRAFRIISSVSSPAAVGRENLFDAVEDPAQLVS